MVHRLAHSNLVSLFRVALQDVPKTDPVAARRAILDPEELAVRHSNIVSVASPKELAREIAP